MIPIYPYLRGPVFSSFSARHHNLQHWSELTLDKLVQSTVQEPEANQACQWYHVNLQPFGCGSQACSPRESSDNSSGGFYRNHSDQLNTCSLEQYTYPVIHLYSFYGYWLTCTAKWSFWLRIIHKIRIRRTIWTCLLIPNGIHFTHDKALAPLQDKEAWIATKLVNWISLTK